MITESELKNWLAENKTVWQIMEVAGCSRNTVVNYMKHHGLASPKGFFRREGKKAGHPPGFTHTPKHLARMSERFRGSGNPFHDKTHSVEAVAKMSRPRPSIQGDNNPFRRAYLSSAAFREVHRERARRRWARYTPEQRQAIRERFAEAQSRNQYHREHASFKNHQNGCHVSPKAGRIFYRSAWERALALFMDGCSAVSTYQSEPFAIPYQDKQGSSRRTTPDFLVDLIGGHRLMIEVKPVALMDYYNNRERIAGQRHYCRTNGLQHALVTGTHIRDQSALAALFQAAMRGEMYVDKPE